MSNKGFIYIIYVCGSRCGFTHYIKKVNVSHKIKKNVVLVWFNKNTQKVSLYNI